MTIITSMWIATKKVKQLQDLVKTYEGRFYGPNVEYNQEKAYITISFEDPYNYREFSGDWQRLNTNIVEIVRKKPWRAILRNFWYQHS